ncbi:response regulator transcription factor [Campylobacter sp. RM16187]|uniref:response regulator transcription factor n=1 Tax=Campylobacter sp. RM16187 TaxID=1660063 RepID=UPI0021B55BBB|nr:response regulator transcription factor [Campylobacter sp. RM16187]QKG28815.1 transcriptional regulator, LuxR family [Campylobacter sp. RM16187]
MKILLYTSSNTLANELKSKLKEHEISLISSNSRILEKIIEGEFDLVLFDAYSNSKETIHDILALNPDTKILVLSRDPNFTEGREYLVLGVKGYANAHMQEVHLNDAINSIVDGNIWLYPEFIQSMIVVMTKESPAVKSTDVLEKLTVKERDIANFIYNGLTNQEIADVSNITLRTVKAHISSIFEKTGVKDRVNLVLLMRSNQ